jgi:hypothetical protein
MSACLSCTTRLLALLCSLAVPVAFLVCTQARKAQEAAREVTGPTEEEQRAAADGAGSSAAAANGGASSSSAAAAGTTLQLNAADAALFDDDDDDDEMLDDDDDGDMDADELEELEQQLQRASAS